MKQLGFDKEMKRIKNKIEELKSEFKMKPKIKIIIQNNVVYSNHKLQSKK